MTQPAAGAEAYASTGIAMWRASAGRPVGRIVASGTQTLNDDIMTAIAFSAADEVDTHGWHDPSTNNTRVTANVAGYVRFYGTVFFSDLATGVSFDVSFRKNGSTELAPAARIIGSTQVTGINCTVMVQMNGTTDYIQMMGRQNSAGNDATQQSAQFSSVLEWEYLRPV